MLVEHVRLLRARGHFVGAVLRSDEASRAMPPWTDVEVDMDVVGGSHGSHGSHMMWVGCWVV